MLQEWEEWQLHNRAVCIGGPQKPVEKDWQESCRMQHM